MLPHRFRCSGLGALRSGSACHRMTSGSVVTGEGLRLGRSRGLLVCGTFPPSQRLVKGLVTSTWNFS
jgi:hypothetical protein